MSSKEYFIYLLSCWLNKEKPRGSEETKWAEILALAERHGVTAVIAGKIKELPHGSRPKGKLLSAFEDRLADSYRDYEKQDRLMDESIEKYLRQGMDYREAFLETKEQIALTGASEHHTGLAVDIVGRNHQSLDRAQADTEEAKWLSEHAHEYGFILRYPEDKEEITMISFESWHYRYVGAEAAAFMKEHNLCLEEFLTLAARQQEQKEAEEVFA